MATENLKVKETSSEAIICNNDYGVSLLGDQSLIFNRTFPEPLEQANDGKISTHGSLK